nr:WYL domain-containing protein [Saprospiraceae bacterium]
MGYQVKGYENLKLLLKAIKLRREITFIHERYQREKRIKYAIQPYLLQEYQHQWHLVAFVPNNNDMRVSGIGRIYELEVIKKVFSDNLDTDPSPLFRNISGVTYSVNHLSLPIKTNARLYDNQAFIVFSADPQGFEP